MFLGDGGRLGLTHRHRNGGQFEGDRLVLAETVSAACRDDGAVFAIAGADHFGGGRVVIEFVEDERSGVFVLGRGGEQSSLLVEDPNRALEDVGQRRCDLAFAAAVENDPREPALDVEQPGQLVFRGVTGFSHPATIAPRSVTSERSRSPTVRWRCRS